MKLTWRQWLPGFPVRASKRTANARPRVRPTLEILEDRTLPSGVSPFVESINRTTSAGLATTATSSMTIVGNVTTFQVSTPAFFFGDVPTSFTVTAEDSAGNIVSNYTGTVSFSSTDKCTAVVLPPNSTLTNGVGVFKATLCSPLTQSITVTDTANNTLTGVSGSISVGGIYLGEDFVSDGDTILVVSGSTDGIHFYQISPNPSVPVALTPPLGGFVRDPDILEYGGKLWCAYTIQAFGAPAGTPPNILGLAVSTDGQHWTGVAGFNPSGELTTGYIDLSTFADGNATGFQNCWAPNWFVDADGSVYITFTASTTSFTSNVLYAIKCKTNPANMLGWGDPTVMTGQTGSGFSFGAGIEDNSLIRYNGKYYEFWDTSVSGSNGASIGYQEQAAVSSAPTPVTGWTQLENQVFQVNQAYLSGNLLYTLDESGWRDYVDNYFNGGGTVYLDQQAGINDFTSGLPLASQYPWTAAAHVSISGSTSSIRAMGVHIVPAPAVSLKVPCPSSSSAGASIPFTVFAQDAQNDLATGYTGTVQFTSTDTAAVLSGDVTLTDGVGVFSAIFNTNGNQTLTATDTLTSSINGASSPIAVSAGAATHFAVSAPPTATAGNAFIFTVTAEDRFNNAATSYTGTATFSSTDGGASTTLPNNSALTSGVGTFSATLTTGGNQTVTATDNNTSGVTGTITGSSGTITVSAQATHFVINAPTTTTADYPVAFLVTAKDQFNNTATGYSGTVFFSSSDGQALFSSPTATLLGGIGFFAATLKTAGNQTIIANDATTPSITGASGSILVIAAPANHLLVTAAPLPSYPGVPTAYPPAQSPVAASTFASTGNPIVFTVTAEDQFGNIDHNYHGTVGFVSSDTAAVLPADSTLTSGFGTFAATLETAGNQAITASDVSTPSISGATNAIVTRGLVVTSFTPTPTGFVIAFNKPFNPSSVIMYTSGTTPDDIMLATTGSQVSVRGSVLLNSPTAPTSITFVKTVLASAVGTFNPGNGLLSQGNYTVTLRSYSASTTNGFQDSLGVALDGMDQANPGANYVYTFSVSAPPTAVGIPDFARGPSNTDALFLPASIGNGNTFNLIYTNPNTAPTTGTATVTFSTVAATLEANIQSDLNALPQIGTAGINVPNAVAVIDNPVTMATQGANVLVTFQNSYFVTATNQVLASTTPGVSIALATINAANDLSGNGIPVALSSGLNVTSGSFTLQYNPSLLTINGAVSKIPGAAFTLSTTINNATSATAVLSLSSPSSISSTTAALTIGSLLATVPFSATASYGAMQLLHFSAEQLNGTAGPITVTNQDAVQVAAFFGDVNDTGLPFPSSGAVAAISIVAGENPNVIMQTLPGFVAFPNLDPAIIGEVNLGGLSYITALDINKMNQQLTVGQPTIPWLPAGLAVTPAGVSDPTLSIGYLAPGDSPGAKYRGGTVSVPVNTDTVQPQGNTGMVDIQGEFVLQTGLLQAPAAITKPDWLADDELEYWAQTAQRGLLTSAADLLDSAAPGPDGGDLAGLEAYFASKAGQRGQ